MGFSRTCLTTLTWLVAVGFLSAQNGEERHADLIEARPTTKAELDHLEAMSLYAIASLKESANCLIEASHLYEEALRLEPNAAPVLRSLASLYFALDRIEDGCKSCEKILSIDPDDFATGLLLARHLRILARPRDALQMLDKIAANPKLVAHPDLRAQVHCDIAALNETLDDTPKVEASLRVLVSVLEEPGPLVELGPYSREELVVQAAETYERLGRLCLKLNQPTQALADFARAGKKDPTRSGRLAYNQTEVLVNQGKAAEALDRLQDYLRTQPNGNEAYEMRISLQRQLGKVEAIVPDLETACARESHNVGLHLLLAREYRRAGRSDAAEATYQRLIADNSNGPEVYRGLFDTFRERDDPGTKNAFALLDTTIRQAAGEIEARVPGQDRQEDPVAAGRARAMLAALRDDPVLVKRLLIEANRRLTTPNKPGYTTRSSLALLAYRTKQLDIAEKLYRSCLDQPGGMFGEIEHDVYVGLVIILEQGHKYQALVDLCTRGLKEAVVTNRLMLRLALARSLMSLDRVKLALEQIELAVQEAPNTEVLHCRLNRAQMQANAGNAKAGISECLELLKEYNQLKDVRGIRLTLSNIYSLTHEADRSEEQLKKILEIDPNDATANNDLGYQWADQSKNLEEAEKLIRKALELDRLQRTTGSHVGTDEGEETAAYIDSLGWVLFRLGKLDEARKELEKASLIPDGAEDPVVWDHLGDVLARQKQWPKARDCWRKASKLYDLGLRHKTDGRYNDIKEKLEQQEP